MASEGKSVNDHQLSGLSLGEGFMVLLLGAAAVGAGVGYFAGGRRIWPTAIGAVALPGGYLAYSAWRSGQKVRRLKACLETFCASNPDKCASGIPQGSSTNVCLGV